MHIAFATVCNAADDIVEAGRQAYYCCHTPECPHPVGSLEEDLWWLGVEMAEYEESQS